MAAGGCGVLLLPHHLFTGLGTQVSYTTPRGFLPDGEGNQDGGAWGEVGRGSNCWPPLGEGVDLLTPGDLSWTLDLCWHARDKAAGLAGESWPGVKTWSSRLLCDPTFSVPSLGGSSGLLGTLKVYLILSPLCEVGILPPV